MVDDFDEFGVSSEDKLARGDGGDISREMVGDDVDAEGAAPPPEGEGGEPVVVVDADSDIPGTVEEFTPPRERVVVEVPVDMIVPSPYQRRRTFDVGRLEEMAASIRAHGVLQPIVVRRPSSPDGEGAADGPAPTRYELIAGERRWRAARMAGLATIPALLVHCTELEAARLCAIENLQREDLNAIEEAETYRVMVDLGMTQGELGEQIGKSQSAIANSLRLLRLPAPVQTLLVDGPLTASHGKALAREAGFPPVCQRIAEIAVAKGASTKELELTGPCKLPYAHQLADEGIVLQFAYGAGGFPWKDTCPDCPFGAFRAGYHEHHGFCLRPEHAQELRQQHEEAMRERIRAAQHPAGDGDGLGELPPESAHGDARPPLPKRADLKYGTYEDVRKPDRYFSECDGCADLVQVLGYSGQLEPVCLNPKCFKRHHMAAAKAAKAGLRKEMAGLLERAGVYLGGMTVVVDLAATRALSLVVAKAVRQCAPTCCQAAAEACGFPEELARKVRTATDEAVPLLASQDAILLLRFAVECLVREEVKNRIEQGYSRTPYASWLLGEEAEKPQISPMGADGGARTAPPPPPEGEGADGTYEACVGCVYWPRCGLEPPVDGCPCPSYKVAQVAPASPVADAIGDMRGSCMGCAHWRGSVGDAFMGTCLLDGERCHADDSCEEYQP